MYAYQNLLEFYKDKRVFVTGHTGFKGSWLCSILLKAGAIVTGYSIEPNTEPALFNIIGLSEREGMTSVIGDIRDIDSLKEAFKKASPEIVFHLAAQPLVIDSYKMPAYTYETNVMGTVNILECIKDTIGTDCQVKSFLNVTTDKVYTNDESGAAFTEEMPLDGYDPYSNSKSCSELVTHSYRNAFLAMAGIPVSTARAGNVIGGGDFSENRIVPDCVEAALKKKDIEVRNPFSIRPFQHVLEPLFAYLMIAREQYDDIAFARAYNVGPDERDCVTTGELADIFCKAWGEGIKWNGPDPESKEAEEMRKKFHEAGFLKLDCSRLKSVFKWEPSWDINEAINKTVEWSKAWNLGDNMSSFVDKQIEEFIKN